ncbi:hypothetical protein A9Q86_14910 [Flavobacteriales bacterium 33_180_T64]|nr:hypothetical protein A9Q86_14910 [Flavobacteriales bacterium 33_180_T64]
MRIFFILIALVIIIKVEAQSSVLSRADSLYINGNYSKAIATYKTYNDQAEVYNKIARAYVAIGNYDLALTNYEASIKANSDGALVKYEYARLLSKTKQFKKAATVFNDLVNVDYKNPNYHYELGLVLDKLKDSTAINRYRSAYDLDKTHQKAIYKIAKYFLKKRKHSLAEDYIDKGLENYKNNVELISLKAQSYYLQEYYTKAQVWFKKLIDLGESSEFIHEKLSLCYSQNYEFELAIEQRKLALKFNPYNANALFVIGTYYEKLKDYVNAEKYIKEALTFKDVALGYEYQKLGVVLNRQNKYRAAIEAFEKAVKEDPENISYVFYIISTKDKFYADIDVKIKLYEDFKEKYPQSVYTQFAVARLAELKADKFLKQKE